MEPIAKLTKKIDDIDIYAEIYAKGILAEKFDTIFNDGKFSAEANNNILIMLHGNSEDHTVFAKNVEILCEKNICILPDSRGHGKTSAGTNDFSIDLMAEDLSKLCDELNLGKFKLLGFSDGGNIALTYAIRHPERTACLIAAGANINPQGLKLKAKIPIFAQYVYAYAKLKLNKVKDFSLWHKFQLMSLMVNYPHISPRMLNNIDCPTLIIDGENDLIKLSHTKLIFTSIPNAKHQTVPNSGHNIFNDNAEYTNNVIMKFISDI